MSFGIYIHFPYCRSKCPYCDFASYPAKTIDFALWNEKYADALTVYARRLPDKTVSSVFFGGGTPSLMPPELIGSVIAKIKALWKCADDTEISMEANPCSVDLDKLRAYRAAGITRLSLGVQALNDKDLKFLGRLHSVEQALRAVSDAKQIFDDVSADLIYARPTQTYAQWQSELDQALSLNLKHLSLYQLTLEEGTYFYKKGLEMPEDALCADLFTLTDRMTYQRVCPATKCPTTPQKVTSAATICCIGRAVNGSASVPPRTDALRKTGNSLPQRKAESPPNGWNTKAAKKSF